MYIYPLSPWQKWCMSLGPLDLGRLTLKLPLGTLNELTAISAGFLGSGSQCESVKGRC